MHHLRCSVDLVMSQKNVHASGFSNRERDQNEVTIYKQECSDGNEAFQIQANKIYPDGKTTCQEQDRQISQKFNGQCYLSLLSV